MGRSPWAPEVFNCSAPDTGNMETLVRYGDEDQKEKWLKPLLEGKIRSAFCMTEPDVASSGPTNIQASIVREGDDYLLNGTKWWASGRRRPPLAEYIFSWARPTPRGRKRQQSIILVPRATPGVTVLRNLSVFGYDTAPHGMPTFASKTSGSEPPICSSARAAV